MRSFFTRRFFVLGLALSLSFFPISGAAQEEEPASKPSARSAAELFAEQRAGKTAEEQREESGLTPYELRDQSLPKEKILVAPERSTLRSLEQARQMIERSRIQDAVRQIGNVLEQSEDYFLEAENESDRVSRKTLRKSAEQLLLALPEEGRRLYALQYDPLARRLLENAVESGSIEQVGKITESYFHTEAGTEAAFLLAMHQFHQGARASAILILRRIAESVPSLDPFEPTFSLTLASCEKALGYEEDARKTIERFLRQNPRPEIRIAGEEFWTPENAAEILEKLDSWNVEPLVSHWIEHSGWLLSPGTASQNPEVEASAPLLELLWKFRILWNPKLLGTLRLIEGQIRNAKHTYIPASRPIAVGDLLIFRGHEGIIALNAKNGKRIWIGKESDYKMPTAGTTFFNAYGNSQENVQLHSILMRTNLWHNLGLGTLMSDGTRVYCVENEPNVENKWRGRGGVLLQGGKQIDDPRERISTTITARDVRSGEVVWKVGKAVLVQKILNQIEEELQEEHKKRLHTDHPIPAGVLPRGLPGLEEIPIQQHVPRMRPVPAEEIGESPAEPPENSPLEEPVEDRNVQESKDIAPEKSGEKSDPETTITEEEQFLGDTYFLGPPLPVLDRLYVLGENSGIIRLFVLESKSGRLIRHTALIEPRVSIETDWLRRFRGPVPSYSEGVLVCPTGGGSLAAFEAISGSPLWFYTYSDHSGDAEDSSDVHQENRGFGTIVPYESLPFNFSGENESYQYLVDYVGWSVPSMIIHGGKILFAPADRPMLYCFDLLSGELIWKRSKGKGLYVACVYGEKVIVATHDSLVALDLHSGCSLWDDTSLKPLAFKSAPNSMQRRFQVRPSLPDPRIIERENSGTSVRVGKSQLPVLAFPEGLSPGGIGIRNENLYMIPMSDQSVLIVDLDSCSLVKKWKSIDESPLGNLIAIGGKVFSQSATEVNCFHQYEILRKWAEKQLGDNPNHAEALLQLGRLAFADGDRDAAIGFFQNSFHASPNPKNKAALRSVLSESFAIDFSKYRVPLDRIESLQEEPDSLTDILLAYAEGCVRIEDYAQFALAFRRILQIDRNQRILREIGTREELLLSRWIGMQVQRFSKKPELKSFMEKLAREEFERISSLHDPENPGVSTRERSRNLRRQWTHYLECFGSLPLAESAREKLYQYYEQQERFSEIEFLIQNTTEGNSGMDFGELMDLLPSDLPDKDSPRTGKDFNSNVPESEPSSEGGSVSGDSAKNAFPGLSSCNPLYANRFSREDREESLNPDRRKAASAILKLARSMEKLEEWESALYYYGILGRFFADVELPDSNSETGREIFKEIAQQSKYQHLLPTKNWPPGIVEFQSFETGKDEITIATEGFRGPFGLARQMGNLIPIPLINENSPFFSGDSFSLAVSDGKPNRLFCWDKSGRKKWSTEIQEDSSDVHGAELAAFPYHHGIYNPSVLGSMGILRGYNHVLYFLRGKNLYAIDTLRRNEDAEAAILWKKTLQSSFGGVRNMRISAKVEQIFSHRWYGGDANAMMLVNPLFVNAQIVCFHDMDSLYGVDPLSGETIWRRDSLSLQSYLSGDEKYVYQIRASGSKESDEQIRSPLAPHDISHEVVVLDCITGEEISRKELPRGIIHAFGSTFHTLELSSQNSGGRYNLCIYDFRDLLKADKPKDAVESPQQKRQRALSTDPGEIESGELKPAIAKTSLGGGTIVNVLENGRILGILTTTRELHLIDLLKREPLLPAPIQVPKPTDIFGRTPGVHNRCDDFHLEFDAKEFVLLYVFDQNAQPGSVFSKKRDKIVNRSQLNGPKQRLVGRGCVMRYDFEGKEKWEKPVPIENWFALDSPHPFPVMLFGAMFFEERGKQPPSTYPVFWGLDKKTGQRRFSKVFESDPSVQMNQMHNFTIRTFVDPEKNEVIFSSPIWKIVGTFTDREERKEEKCSEISDSAKESFGPIPGILRALEKKNPWKVEKIMEQMENLYLEFDPEMELHWDEDDEE